MSWFSSSSNKDRVSVILDIGSSSVGAAFVSLLPGQKPIILYSKRFPISTKEKPRATELAELMVKTINLALTDLADSGVRKLHLGHKKIKVDQVFAVLAAPWYSPDIKKISIKDKTPITVSSDFINSTIENDLATYTEQLNKSHLEIIEQHVMSITLNGYKIKAPFGKKAKQVELTLFISALPQSITAAIHHHSASTFNVDKIILATFTLVGYSTIINLFKKEDDFIFMDITGEVTDISVVLDDVLVDNISFPSGKNLPIRRLAKEFDVSPEIAVSFIKLFLENQAETSLVERIKPILFDTQNEWLIYFNQAFGELGARHALPTKLFLTTDSEVATLFTNAINRNQTTPAQYQPQTLTNLDHQTVKELVTFAPSEPKDPFIALIASHLDLVLARSSQQ